MRARSDTWLRLVNNGDFTLEAKATIAGKDYYTITAPRINRRVADKAFSIGNCNAASLQLSVKTEDVIPSGAEIIISGRVTDGATTNPECSEWLTFGTFYIERRDSKVAQGITSFTCYDAMLKVNQPFFHDIVESWPQPMAKVVSDIARIIGVGVDPRTHINVGEDYQVRYDSDLTMGQVLGYIGACHGGNWIITPDNNLLLVPLFPEREGAMDVCAVLGGWPTVGQAVTVTGVTMTDTEDTEFGAGDSSGQVVTVTGCPYATQEICEALYQSLRGKVYYPFKAQKAIYDPAAELGDTVTLKDHVQSVLWQETTTLDFFFQGDIEAPDSQEVTSEYPYQGNLDQAQILKNEIKRRVNTSIKMGLEDITATVEEVSGRVSQLQMSLDGITLSVSEPFPDGSGQSYVSISLTVNGHTTTGLVKISGNVDISGQLSAAALYAAKGDIAKLTVDSVSTSRRIPLYLAGDTSDDNYIEISDQHISFVHAATDGSSQQAVNPDGAPLFWEEDVSEASLGEDGYPYLDGTRVFTTTEQTDWPVMVYVYTEQIKRQSSFNTDADHTPIDAYGVGYGLDDPDRGKGFIQKRATSFDLWLVNRDGEERGVFIGDEYTDIVGLRKPTELDFTGWDNGYFTETIDGGITLSYQVDFDAEGRPALITDSAGHTTVIRW